MRNDYEFTLSVSFTRIHRFVFRLLSVSGVASSSISSLSVAPVRSRSATLNIHVLRHRLSTKNHFPPTSTYIPF